MYSYKPSHMNLTFRICNFEAGIMSYKYQIYQEVTDNLLLTNKMENV